MKRRGLAAVLAAVLLLLSACGGKPVDGGEIRVGLCSAVSGELGIGQWQSSEADETIRSLTDGGSPVVRSVSGEYSIDRRYVKSIDSVFLPDGSKTYTVDLRRDICWSDGSEVTAANYVASVLLFSGSAAKTAGAAGTPGTYYVGAEEYLESGIFAGVHLTDKYTFSVTVKAEHIPYYWEYEYLDIIPIDTALWLPEGVTIADNGAGSSFTSADLITAEGINSARFASSARKSLGPYAFAGWEDGWAVLEKNPNYLPLERDGEPHIERLLFIETDGTAAALDNGKVDIVVGLRNAKAAATALEESGEFAFSDYGGNEILDLVFQCDFGPTQYAEVRQAVAYLCDRQGLASELLGDGATVPEYVFSGTLEEMISGEIATKSYIRSPNKARELLIDGGWTLNAAGEVYTSGVRYKLVSAEEAEDSIDAVVLSDGRILMPLRLRFACTENTGHIRFFENLAALANGIGMEVVSAELQEDVLTDRLTRNASNGIAYAVGLYNGYLIELPIDTKGDLSVRWTSDWRAVSEGRNICYFEDETLCDLAIKLSFGSESSEEFSRLLTEHTLRWSETVPELPVARARLWDIYSVKLSGYEASDTKPFSVAIAEAWVEEG